MKNPSNFDPSRFPRRLNLGCGSDYRDGYLNIDLNAWYRCDLVADIRKLEFLPSQYYEELVAQDVLEHLPRTETLRKLDLLHGSFFDAWNDKTSHIQSPLPLDHERLLAIGDDDAFIGPATWNSCIARRTRADSTSTATGCGAAA